MRRMLGLFIVLAAAPGAQAADVDAGKAKAAAVRAGPNFAKSGVTFRESYVQLADAK